MTMKASSYLRFWGVRGSIPVPGEQTLDYGGNTSCVEVCAAQTHVIFDAGTGIRELGKHVRGKPAQTYHLFLSHLHWDHIQGFPFFEPLYNPQTTIHLYGVNSAVASVESSLAGQMNHANFPLALSDLPCKLVFHEVSPNQPIAISNKITVTAMPGQHPGGVFLYRIATASYSMVYATDTEHDAKPTRALIEFLQNADVLIYDSTYTPDEYEGYVGQSKEGWGHSTYAAGALLAKLADVRQLVLFHHEPDRSDRALTMIEKKARKLFPHTRAAAEGLRLKFG